jgi:4-hydroxy-tetrahydrodipicolinate reductase
MSAATARHADGDIEVAYLIARTRRNGQRRPVPASLDLLDETPDLLLDFSLPAGTAVAAGWCRRSGVALLSGVTGLDEAARDGLARAARDIAVLWSPNYSLGVNLLAQLCQRAASVLGPGAHVHIEDVHHQWKKDMPSGTALMLGAAMQDVRSPAADAPEYRSRREGEVINTASPSNGG